MLAGVAGGFNTFACETSRLGHGQVVPPGCFVAEALQLLGHSCVEWRLKQQRLGQPLMVNVRLAECLGRRHLEPGHVQQNLQR